MIEWNESLNRGSDSMFHTGVDVLWIAKCKYMNGQRIDSHAHKFFQYIYVVEGQGRITIGDTQYSFQKDHVYMIPVSAVHDFAAGDQEELQTIEVKFDVRNEEIRDLVSQMPETMLLNNPAIKQIMEGMIKEGQEAIDYYTDIIQLKFCELLTRLFRAREQEQDSLASKAIEPDFADEDDPVFKPVISFIRDHMSESITLEKLSDIACLEKTYFSKKFKEKYGNSPIHILNGMRLSKAKELLKYANMNITQISQQTGFQSLHYFSRFFTQKEGISPYEYRQKYGQDVYLYFEEERKVNGHMYK
jgi:AraC-like DNA-binding protein